MVPFLLDTPEHTTSNNKKQQQHVLQYGNTKSRVIVAPVTKTNISLEGTASQKQSQWQNHTASHQEKSWSNERAIVHVIYTRFMQHQPNLVALGLARLKLFTTFCLPTIKKQTNQHFLWIIRTDPDLDVTLKDGLIGAVSELSNVVVVGSNEVRKGSLDGGFRSEDSIEDIDEDSLFFGSLKLVQSFHGAAQLRNVLETNVDADDGLGLNFVESVQNMTYHNFHGKHKKTAWFNICVGRHLEWQYYAPWDNATDKGSLQLGSTHICVTSGLSWATMRKADPEFTESHHLIKKETKDCKDAKKSHMGCWAELPETEFMAIRARTPTSTGMARVLTDETSWTEEQVDEDKAHWKTLDESFGIMQASIQKSRRYLTDHLELIVEDNLKGQCMKDHSCSENIKKKLKKIIYKDTMWKNKYNVVHVIQTSLDSSLSVYVLDQFGFASLEAQTSYEFLWIIRLKELPEDEQEDMERFLTSNIVGKSPLNIVVVKSDQTSTVNFRSTQAIEDITEETLLYGDIAMLQDFHNAAQNRTLLETSLEPSDALSKTFVEEIHGSTAKQLEESQLLDDANSWYYRCNSQYIGWEYFTPEGYESDAGFLGIAGSVDGKCGDSPGATRISLPRAEIPYSSEIGGTECEKLVVLRIQNGCYVPVFSNETLAARAIVPESVESPQPIHVGVNDLELLAEDDRHLRSVLRDAFNIFPAAVEAMRSRIQKTQCSDSQSCNPKWDSEHGVTHVIQTSIHNESEYLYWRYFCMSLEVQTTKKFLWIIRVDLNSHFEEKLLETINNIPLNVIAAKSRSAPSEFFRLPAAIADLNNETLIYGDLTMLEYFHRSSQRRPLLETFLSPTDSLSKRFISDIQKAFAMEVKGRSGVHAGGAWYYRCIPKFFDWIPNAAATTPNSTGFLRTSRDVQNCLSRPGTTRISTPGTVIPSGDIDDALNRPCEDAAGWQPSGCYATYKPGTKTARVRTLESNHDEEGSKGITAATKSIEEQIQGYESLRLDFGIYRMSLMQLVSKMKERASPGVPNAWENKRKVVHVVYTRFLQQQGTLMQLGTARMKLFQSICVPAVTAQTNKQFLWIVRTDPELLPELKESLISTLTTVPNVLLVASDIGVDGHHDGSFRANGLLNEFNKSSVLLGDLNLLRSYHEASKEHMLVETNLDSDDGIALTFVDQIQAKVTSLFAADRHGIGWVQLCIGNHLEWHFYSPWEKKSDKGCLLRGKTRSCIKSGMSWATQPKSRPSFMTALHNLKEYLPSCSFNRTADTLLFEGCWDEAELDDPEHDFMALRTMSPVSSGVARGEISKFDWGVQALLFEKTAWWLLDPYFSVRLEWIKDVRKHLYDNLSLVSGDNERSKCTHEKTCAGKWKNTHRIVHVIHTELHDPNLADMLHRVSLSSLTRQTSYEFLWIIRAADFTDYRLVLSILEPLRKSSFAENIVLVKSETAPALNFRSDDGFADITEESVIHGDIAILQDYHQACQTRPLLETFLRPSEGLIRTFIDDLQSSTAELFNNATRAYEEDGWYYHCVPEYMERSYFAPNGDEAENGFLKVLHTKEEDCMDSPGTTRISLPNSAIQGPLPKKDRKLCQGNIDTFRRGCFIEMESAKTPALRIRLPVKGEKQDGSVNENKQDVFANQRRFALQLRLLYSVFPPTLQEMQSIMNENDRQIVHIIHTALRDEAEINTWRHFCVESIFSQNDENVTQSNESFFWIIRTDFNDSMLIKGISNPLRYNYHQPRNVILVRSNFTPSAVDFRSSDSITDITKDTVVRGSLEELKNVHLASQGRTVIETFLQPTENMAKIFVEHIQRLVQVKTTRDQMMGIKVAKDHGKEQADAWYFYCVPHFIQWSYFGPHDKKFRRGVLRRIAPDETLCMKNPALTRVSFPGSRVHTISDLSELKPCSLVQKNGCYSHIDESVTLASRAILPTSADQASAEWTDDEISNLEKQNSALSTLLSKDFNISPFPLETMTIQMEKSYCGDSGTCHAQYDSEYGMVHIVQTSVQDLKMFQVWRRFCFALESQTTTKFLWILRVGSDEGLIKEVKKPIRKTPLNIIVARSNYTLALPFQHENALQDLTDDSIIQGDKELLEYFHNSAKKRPVLETFLSPTDALDKSFVLRLQNTTAEQLKTFHLEQDSWYYQCVPSYIEWTYHSSNEASDSEIGTLQVTPNDEKRCVSHPGTSRVSVPGATIPDGVLNDSGLCTAPANMKKGCALPIRSHSPIAARVVIPSSLDVPPPKSSLQQKVIDKQQDSLVTMMKTDFGIPPQFLKQMRIKLKPMIK
ncbi:unnamed protein product [Cylindrotheca closterium]|uniref:Uncharacterized protein n=1 Tax=Cylindrotheca closterium TaxID=2856 RepID=A0AAD2JGF7_9STRA|nr:unnamed protein product [Cylindrotheca closterium]